MLDLQSGDGAGGRGGEAGVVAGEVVEGVGIWWWRFEVGSICVGGAKLVPVGVLGYPVTPMICVVNHRLVYGTGQRSRTSIEVGDVSGWSSAGTENPIPEEMDHREIGVPVSVMNEVQLLFPSEPCKPLKSRSLYVVFLVEKDVRVERRRTSDYLNHEEIEWQ